MAFLRVLVMVCVLVIPSVVFAHMSTYNEEMQAHGVYYGGDAFGAAILRYMPPGNNWNYVYNVTIDPNKWYVLLSGNVNRSNSNNGVNYLDNPLDTSLLHDIKLNNQGGCGSELRYLGYIMNDTFPNWRDPNDGVYTLVYTSTKNITPLGNLAYTTYMQDKLKIYDFQFFKYHWVFDPEVAAYNGGYPEKVYLGSDGNPSLTIMRKTRVYDSYIQRYAYRFDPYLPIQDSFSDVQFFSAVRSDREKGEGYGIGIPVTCDDGSGWNAVELNVYGIFPFCGDKDNWKFKLGYPYSGGVRQLNVSWGVTWELWLKPKFSGVGLNKIYTTRAGSEIDLSKSLFVQDSTIYQYEGNTYQGTAYWEVRAIYGGNTYYYQVYDAAPPCKEALEYISGDGQEGLICEELKKPFVVKVTDENSQPESGIGINWQVKEQPESAGATVKPESTQTYSDGLASTYLKLGSSAGEYTVEAACGDCTEGSPQTFKATAKCPEVPVYYQGDYSDPYDNWCKYVDPITKQTKNATCEWEDGKPKTGYTQYTIAKKGCALTSMAMVAKRYYSSEPTPDIWNDFMTASGGYVSGAVDWHTLTTVNSDIKTALYKKSETPLPNSLMDTYLAKCMPVIVKVINPSTGSWHWIVVTGKSGDNYLINDPGYRTRADLSEYNNEIYAIQVYQERIGGCK